MIRPSTHICTPDLGPRPAGEPDRCFYCPSKLGEPHAPECVIRQRTVVLRYSYDVVVSVPEHWTEEHINFHRNDSTWCADNSLGNIKAYTAALERDGQCWCARFGSKYLREASADEDTLTDKEVSG